MAVEDTVRKYYSLLNDCPSSALFLFVKHSRVRRVDNAELNAESYKEIYAVLTSMKSCKFVLHTIDTFGTFGLLAMVTGTFFPSSSSTKPSKFVEALTLTGSAGGLRILYSLFRSMDCVMPYSNWEGPSYSLGANLNVADTGVEHHMLAGATSLASSSRTGVLLSSTEELAENGVGYMLINSIEVPVGGGAIEEQLDAPEYVPTYAEMLWALPGFTPAADPTLDH